MAVWLPKTAVSDCAGFVLCLESVSLPLGCRRPVGVKRVYGRPAKTAMTTSSVHSGFWGKLLTWARFAFTLSSTCLLCCDGHVALITDGEGRASTHRHPTKGHLPQCPSERLPGVGHMNSNRRGIEL